MSRRTVAVVAVAVLVVAGAVCASPTRPTHITPFDPQGEFEVQALVGGLWQHIGALSYDRYVREHALTLPAAAISGPYVRVRLVQRGGGAAQIDRVVLGEAAAIRVAGTVEPDAVALTARRDNDVVDASRRTIELTFAGGARETALRLAARIEPKVNEGKPLEFPPENQWKPLTPASSFYAYRPAADGRRPSWPGTLDPSHALFAEYCLPTSGHPDGTTYGWVANDRDTLYAEVEFTPDNTCDGDKDFSTVTVLRNGRLREFKVSEALTRWGHPSFLVTERAVYHHKLYAFAIPFSELGARDARDAGELKLAFSAYGTTSVQFLVNPSSHDFGAIAVGSTSAAFIATVINNTGGGITLDTPYFTDNGPNSNQFQLTDITCHSGTTLANLAKCTFQVVFAPTVTGTATDGYTVNAHTVPGIPLPGAPLAVQGEGVTPIPAFGLGGMALLILAVSVLGYFVLRRR
ncbi:MAG TPA: hypothetical protein VMT19_11080 [Thermoanaerobaculaceae bacterium]|nr:hypothetical protein [Thermoanaerobaculaceae bacterium]